MSLEEAKERNYLFRRRIGTISDYEVLRFYGLEPLNIAGSFGREHLPQLVELCEAEPSLHIYTRLSDRVVNKIDPMGLIFGLADGDPDPSLELLDPKELTQQLSAMMDHVKRCRDT